MAVIMQTFDVFDFVSKGPTNSGSTLVLQHQSAEQMVTQHRDP